MLRRRAAGQSKAAVLTSATLGVVHDAYEALFPDQGRHRATLRKRRLRVEGDIARLDLRGQDARAVRCLQDAEQPHDQVR